MEYHYPKFTPEMKKTHTILIPNMAVTQFRLMEYALRCEGYKCELLGNCGSAVAQLGLKYVHNDTCYPALLVIGQFLDALNSGKYDLEHTALLITQTGGGCRASNYIHLLRKALVKAGYPQIPVASLNFSGLEKDSGFQMTLPLARKCIACIFYGDMLCALRNQVAPYENEKGAADRMADRWIARLGRALLAGKGFTSREMKHTFPLIAKEFATIPVTRVPKVKVGVVGEIYVKYSPLGNNDLQYFDFNKDNLIAIAKEAAELNLDMLVLDDGWFGKRDDDFSGLGDWFVNEKKLCGTLSELVKEVHDMGLSFGLWFEPEMISEDSDLYRAHPDWALVIPGRQPIRSRSQLVLDMSREDVTDYLTERICDIVEKADIQYIKWDMNRSLMAAYSALLPRDRQGELRHRYVLGLYKVLEAVTQRFPELLLEGCSGGGGRFDAGMLYYCPQIWCSDNTDAIERLRIQYGTSFGYPMSSVSAHVSVCPNHQNHRVTPFKTRGICAMQGTFGYELDLSKMTDEEKKMAGEQIAFFKEHGRLFQFGDYYRLTSPFENRDYTVWEYAAQDGSEACMSVVYTDMYANAASEIVKWKGLDPKKVYQMQLDGEDAGNFSGAALMHAGILLPLPEQNYDAFQIYLKAE